jgi:hypothetical protein
MVRGKNIKMFLVDLSSKKSAWYHMNQCCLCTRLKLFWYKLVGFNKVSHLWLQIKVKDCEQVVFKL